MEKIIREPVSSPPRMYVARECARMEQQLVEKKESEIEDVGVLYFSEANVFSSVLPNDWWKKADLCNASRNVTVT